MLKDMWTLAFLPPILAQDSRSSNSDTYEGNGDNSMHGGAVYVRKGGAFLINGDMSFFGNQLGDVGWGNQDNQF
jgi:hypothetical protein